MKVRKTQTPKVVVRFVFEKCRLGICVLVTLALSTSFVRIQEVDASHNGTLSTLANSVEFDVGNDTASGVNRTSKFLFDALFGIDQPLTYDDVDEENDEEIKACNCGKCALAELIQKCQCLN